MTELAMLLPFLALMFAAVLDFGRVFHATQTVQQCAFAGATCASGHSQMPSSVSAEQAARDAASDCGASLRPALRSEDVTVTTNTTAKTVTVTVEYEFELLTPVLGPLAPIRLSRSTTLPTAARPGD